MNTDQTILIIEDDDFLRSLAVTKLEKEGLTVDIAIDGVEGLRKINETQPALILLDLMLPNLDGFELMQRLQEAGTLGQYKIIIFSNLGSEEDIRRAQQYGVEDYLVKSSFTLDELVEKIKESLS
ncbi:response regulator [Candidatus Nomurabacteria bacterium]|nr:response regulator [Candidatus Nomurabacteria bacterium]